MERTQVVLRLSVRHDSIKKKKIVISSTDAGWPTRDAVCFFLKIFLLPRKTQLHVRRHIYSYYYDIVLTSLNDFKSHIAAAAAQSKSLRHGGGDGRWECCVIIWYYIIIRSRPLIIFFYPLTGVSVSIYIILYVMVWTFYTFSYTFRAAYHRHIV